MRSTRFSALDLPDLPPLEREVVLRTARDGPVVVDALAGETGNGPSAVRRVVDRLGQGGDEHAFSVRVPAEHAYILVTTLINADNGQ